MRVFAGATCLQMTCNCAIAVHMNLHTTRDTQAISCHSVSKREEGPHRTQRPMHPCAFVATAPNAHEGPRQRGIHARTLGSERRAHKHTRDGTGASGAGHRRSHQPCINRRRSRRRSRRRMHAARSAPALGAALDAPPSPTAPTRSGPLRAPRPLHWAGPRRAGLVATRWLGPRHGRRPVGRQSAARSAVRSAARSATRSAVGRRRGRWRGGADGGDGVAAAVVARRWR